MYSKMSSTGNSFDISNSNDNVTLNDVRGDIFYTEHCKKFLLRQHICSLSLEKCWPRQARFLTPGSLYSLNLNTPHADADKCFRFGLSSKNVHISSCGRLFSINQPVIAEEWRRNGGGTGRGNTTDTRCFICHILLFPSMLSCRHDIWFQK